MDAREKLTTKIQARIIQTSPTTAPEEARQIAAEKVEEKISKSKLGALIAAIGIIGGTLSWTLNFHPLFIFVSVIGGCLWGATVWSGEYMWTAAGNAVEKIANGIKAIRKAFGLGGGDA